MTAVGERCSRSPRRDRPLAALLRVCHTCAPRPLTYIRAGLAGPGGRHPLARGGRACEAMARAGHRAAATDCAARAARNGHRSLLVFPRRPLPEVGAVERLPGAVANPRHADASRVQGDH